MGNMLKLSMPGISREQIEAYYESYRDRDLLLSKELVHTIGLDTRQISLAFGGSQWPCIINFVSLSGASLIISVRGVAYSILSSKHIENVTLKMLFVQKEVGSFTFNLDSKLEGMKPYTGGQDFIQLSISFLQRPPDDFIEIIGRSIETNQNYAQRREERILITPESKKLLHILREEMVVFFQNVPRRCILRDVSFSGAKIIVMGLSQFLAGKKLLLKIPFYDPIETFNISGTVVAVSNVEDRKDLVYVSIRYDDQTIPFAYKAHINNYLTFARNLILDKEDASKKAAVKAEPENEVSEAEVAAKEVATNEVSENEVLEKSE